MRSTVGSGGRAKPTVDGSPRSRHAASRAGTRRAARGARALAEAVVRREQLIAVADVQPLARGADSRTRARACRATRPCARAGRAGCPGRGTWRSASRARGSRGSRRSRPARSAAPRASRRTNDALVLVELDDGVLLDQLAVVDFGERDRAGNTLPRHQRTYSARLRSNRLSHGDDQQVVVEARPLDDELDVADRAQPVVLARRPVVLDDDVRSAPTRGRRRRTRITTWTDSTESTSRIRSRIQSIIGRPPTGRSGFAIVSVSG